MVKVLALARGRISLLLTHCVGHLQSVAVRTYRPTRSTDRSARIDTGRHARRRITDGYTRSLAVHDCWRVAQHHAGPRHGTHCCTEHAAWDPRRDRSCARNWCWSAHAHRRSRNWHFSADRGVGFGLRPGQIAGGTLSALRWRPHNLDELSGQTAEYSLNSFDLDQFGQLFRPRITDEPTQPQGRGFLPCVAATIHFRHGTTKATGFHPPRFAVQCHGHDLECVGRSAGWSHQRYARV